MKEHGLRHGARSKSGSPLTGRKNNKIIVLPMSNGQAPSQITNRVILFMTSRVIGGWKNKTSGTRQNF
jgi:hypothetical protein